MKNTSSWYRVVRQSQELGSEQISRMALATVLKLQPGLTPKRLILKLSFDAALATIWLCIFVLCGDWLHAETIDFEDWSLENETAWIGPVAEDDGTEKPGPFGGIDRVGLISSGSIQLVNRNNLKYGNWSGFAISNKTDISTPGASNQTSSFAGGGAGEGDDHYAIGFGYVDNLEPNEAEQLAALPYFEIAAGSQISSMLVTNTTFTALSMRDGDRFAKQFGGPTGDDPDFFRLSVYGTDANGILLDDVVETFLADYRDTDNTQDFIVDTWTLLDLSMLSDASRLYFNLDSTDSNPAGLATPAYFAVDNIVLARKTVADINRDGSVNSQDADMLCGGIASGDTNPTLDLDHDQIVSTSDLAVLLLEANVKAGDTDFDGAVGFDDFLILSGNFGDIGSWSHGDFDCDGQVGFPDFLTLSGNFGSSNALAVALPEPASWKFTWAVFLVLRRQPTSTVHRR